MVAIEQVEYSWQDFLRMKDSLTDLKLMVTQMNSILTVQLKMNHPHYAAIIKNFIEVNNLQNTNLITCLSQIDDCIIKVLKEISPQGEL